MQNHIEILNQDFYYQIIFFEKVQYKWLKQDKMKMNTRKKKIRIIEQNDLQKTQGLQITTLIINATLVFMSLF